MSVINLWKSPAPASAFRLANPSQLHQLNLLHLSKKVQIAFLAHRDYTLVIDLQLAVSNPALLLEKAPLAFTGMSSLGIDSTHTVTVIFLKLSALPKSWFLCCPKAKSPDRGKLKTYMASGLQHCEKMIQFIVLNEEAPRLSQGKNITEDNKLIGQI